MTVTLTVLGSCGGYQRAGRACSSYLLEHGGSSLVLDFGNGSLANLLKCVQPYELSAGAVTHMHPDHFVDLFSLYTARRFALEPHEPMPLLLPPGARENLDFLLTGEASEGFYQVFDISWIEDRMPVELPGFTVTPFETLHTMEAFSLRVEVGDVVVGYTGDTDLSEGVMEAARDADLLICEATFTNILPFKVPGHLFAREAGGLARKAGAKQLLLTHVWPTLDEGFAIKEAREHYDGPVGSAFEGLTLEL